MNIPLVTTKTRYMKHFLCITAALVLGIICRAQTPQVPTTLTVKGDFSGIYTNDLGNGETEKIIACMCSENTCYTITRISIEKREDGGHLDSDCGGAGVTLIPVGTPITLTLEDGLILYEGNLVSYSNSPSGPDPLQRSNRFVFRQ
ncbi:MAG: hypothetical protein COA58_04670 [Bacteroidetes bacterium]|nr:MAG: hypothetical protein COA58_04670 [Bacteroidota bacterium]